MSTFPTAPSVAGSQLALALEGTHAGAYAAWRKTPDGMRIFLEVERRVVARSNAGEQRIETNDIVADLRRDWKVGIDNDHRAYLSDELITRHPELHTKIKRRRRRAV